MSTNQIRGNTQIMPSTITNAEINAAAEIASTKLANWSADRDGGGFKLTNIADPTSPQHAATKNYVDNIASGLKDMKDSVRVSTVRRVGLDGTTPTYTAAGGASARGQITWATGPTSLDGVTLANGDRMLLKNEQDASGLGGAANGIWVRTSANTWDRSTDFDTDDEVTAGAYVFVTEGTTNADSGWVLSTNDPIIIGGASGTALTFVQFSGAGQITAGAGLTKTGNTIDAVAGDASILVNADEFHVQRSGSTLATDGSGLKVADAGITATQINTSVAGGGILGGGGTALGLDLVQEVPSGTPNGSLTDFVTSSPPFSTAALMVWVNGQYQRPTTDYTLSGSTITFTTAPSTGDSISVFYFK